jgi:hypothetical protein
LQALKDIPSLLHFNLYRRKSVLEEKGQTVKMNLEGLNMARREFCKYV